MTDQQTVIVNCPFADGDGDNGNCPAYMEEAGTSDERKHVIEPMVSQTIGLIFCFGLIPAIMAGIIWMSGGKFADFQWWTHLLFWGVGALLFFGRQTRNGTEPPEWSVPTFLGRRRDWFMFGEGWHWAGFLGDVKMPKSVFTSTVTVFFVSQDQQNMKGTVTIPWFVYNSMNHLQLDQGVNEADEVEKLETAGVFIEGEMRYGSADASHAARIIAEVLRSYGAEQPAESLRIKRSEEIIPKITSHVRSLPGENPEDYRVHLYGIEFETSGISFEGFDFQTPEDAAAYKAKQQELERNKARDVANANFAKRANVLAEELGLSKKEATRILQENDGHVTGVRIDVKGTTNPLVKAGLLSSAEEVLRAALKDKGGNQ